MKQKVIKKYIFEGLGFPIVLINVPMRMMIGEWVLDIDLNLLQKNVLDALIHKSVPLTGAEVRFIRKYFELTTEQWVTIGPSPTLLYNKFGNGLVIDDFIYFIARRTESQFIIVHRYSIEHDVWTRNEIKDPCSKIHFHYSHYPIATSDGDILIPLHNDDRMLLYRVSTKALSLFTISTA